MNDDLFAMLELSLSFAEVAADPALFYEDDEVAEHIAEAERDNERLMAVIEVSRAMLFAERALLDDLERQVFDLIDEGLRRGELESWQVRDLASSLATANGLAWARDWLEVAARAAGGGWIRAVELRD